MRVCFYVFVNISLINVCEWNITFDLSFKWCKKQLLRQIIEKELLLKWLNLKSIRWPNQIHHSLSCDCEIFLILFLFPKKVIIWNNIVYFLGFKSFVKLLFLTMMMIMFESNPNLIFTFDNWCYVIMKILINFVFFCMK